MAQLVPLLCVLQACNKDVSQATLSSEYENTSKLTQVVGRIHFLALVGLKTQLLGGCLEAIFHSQRQLIVLRGPPM